MCRFTPLFGAKVKHIVEEHSNVSGGHGGRACGHIFSFRCGHGDRSRHGRVGFNKSAIVENHVSNGGAASIGAVLPAGIGENSEVCVRNSVMEAYVVDGVGSAIGIEFESVVRAASKVADEPGESSEINNARRDACFCKFADGE